MYCFLWGTNWIDICYVEDSRPPLWSSGQSSWLQNGDVSCFLWGTNSIYVCYVEESRPPLWSSGQSSWLQIQSSGFDSRRYQIFWEAVGLERGPLSLMSTTEELFERKNIGSGQENQDYGNRDPSRWLRRTLYSQKLALTSPTRGSRSVGIVRSRTQATEFVSFVAHECTHFKPTISGKRNAWRVTNEFQGRIGTAPVGIVSGTSFKTGYW
jgi:hypothetical protein